MSDSTLYDSASIDVPYRIAVVCAEPSGDMLASGLIREIRRRFPNAICKGIGGDLAQAEGLDSWFNMDELSVMGLVEVLKHLPRLLQIRRQLKRKLLEFNPDIYIGVDAPDFNLPIETFLKQRNINTVHYVSPTIWAWRESRVNTIKQAAGCVMGLFPFEAAVFTKHNVRYRFVGHPMADAIALLPDQPAARSALSLPDTAQIIALLPGSRSSEVNNLLPVFLQSFALLQIEYPDIIGVIPAVNRAREIQINTMLDSYPAHLKAGIRVSRATARQVMIASDVVLLSSGTATLEAMLCKRPMLSVYKMSWLTYTMMQRLYQPDYFSLPNILADELLVPELLQADVTPAKISRYMLDLLHVIAQPHTDASASAPAQAPDTLLPVNSVGSCLFEVQAAQLNYIMQRFTDIHHSLRKNADEQAATVVSDILTGSATSSVLAQSSDNQPKVS